MCVCASILSRVHGVVNLYLGFIYAYEHNYQITHRKSECFGYNISYSGRFLVPVFAAVSFLAVVVKCLYKSTRCILKYAAITVHDFNIIDIMCGK